ncbi:hypothetical protein [Chitinophaga sp.]
MQRRFEPDRCIPFLFFAFCFFTFQLVFHHF